MTQPGGFYTYSSNTLSASRRFLLKKRLIFGLSFLAAGIITPVAAALQSRSDTPARQETSSTTINVPADSISNTQSSKTSVETKVQGSTTDAEVTVNGQAIPVPENGIVNKTIPSNDGETDVNIRIKNSQSVTDVNNSSTHIDIYSESHSTGSDSNEENSRHPTRR